MTTAAVHIPTPRHRCKLPLPDTLPSHPFVDGEIRKCNECGTYWICRLFRTSPPVSVGWFPLTWFGVWWRKRKGIIPK